CAEVAQLANVRPDDIDPWTPFAAFGIDSRSGVALIAALEDRFATKELSPTALWQYPTVAALSDFIAGRKAPRTAASPHPAVSAYEPIAVIGIGCRMPGASGPKELWDLLRSGADAITTDSRLPGVQAGFLEDVEAFDNELFGISASEAEAM